MTEHDPFAPHHTGGGEEHKSALTKKGPGGIPVWGYGVGIAGAVVLFMYLQGKSGSASSSTSQTPSTGTGGQNASGYTRGGFVPSGRTWRPPWHGFGPEGPPAPSTNSQWGMFVTDWLQSKGENPGDVTDAVNDYLSGQRLDQQEQSMIDLARNVWGNPPDSPLSPAGPPGKRKTERNNRHDTPAASDAGKQTMDTSGNGTGPHTVVIVQ